jgi:hypothetical protein
MASQQLLLGLETSQLANHLAIAKFTLSGWCLQN